MFYPFIKKNGSFLHFSVFYFFYRVASINSVQATVVQFSTFYSSGLTFRIAFNILSKNLINCPQHFNVFMISNRPFSAVPQSLKLKPNSAPYTHDYSNTLFFETQEKVFNSRIFEKFPILLQVKSKWFFAIDLLAVI